MAKAKKALVLFLVFAMFTCSFLSVSAQTTQTSEAPLVCYGSTEEIAPCLVCFESVFCGISIKNGNIVGNGDYTCFVSGVDVTFAVAIEKQSGSTWNQVQATSRKYSPGTGSNLLSTTYKNPSSGTYRTAVTAIATNSNGKILEAIKIYSAKTIQV